MAPAPVIRLHPDDGVLIARSSLPQGLVERFYAARLTLADKARILMGKPPVPIRSALSCLTEAPLLAERAQVA